MEILIAIWNDSLVRWFCLAIIGVALYFYFKERKRKPHIDRIAPAFLTTLGILGTFTGIFFGLQNFDVDAIQESIPDLLTGLRLAFSTSICGMGCAIIYRMACILQTPKQQSKTDDPEPADVYKTLVEIKEASTGLREELVKEFRDFSRRMTEDSTKALIGALESVIRDFNTKLNEQFGDNFKRLKESMDKLLLWQEKYKEHVETMEERIEQAVSANERTEQALQTIVEHTAAIPENMRSLAELLETQRKQMEELEDRLQTFANLKQQAEEAFPIIEKNIERLTTGFAEKVSDAAAEIQKASTEYRAVFTEVRESYNRLGEEISNSVSALQEQSAKVIENIGVEVERILDKQNAAFAALGVGFDRLSADVDKMTDNLNKKAQELAERMTDLATRQQEALENLSSGMQQALEEGVASVRSVVQEMVRDSTAEMHNLAKNISTEIGSILDKQSSAFTELGQRMEGLVTHQQEAFENISGDIRKTIDESMQSARSAIQDLVRESMKELKGFTESQVRELSKEFQGAGQELVSISAKLAENWQGLAETLPDIVIPKQEENK
ncbi:MAG: hypothetical protein GDA55_00295 [Cellvibrionales bacterium]|nr:hypothetical protein [Cellvibrionales bacterium]